LPRGRFGLVAGLVAITVAACTPSPPSAVNPSPAVASAAATPPRPTASPAEASPIASAVPTVAVYPRLPVPAGTNRCHTAQVAIAFVRVGVAAGNVEATFEMRNKSQTPCWVYGFVGFQTLDPNGRPMPRTVSWTTDSFFGKSDRATRILLPPGTAPFGSQPRTGYAFFNVAGNDVQCDASQVPVANFEIWPPDERQSVIVPAKSLEGGEFYFCGAIDLNPLQIQPEPSFG